MKLLASNKVVDSEYELAANDIRRIRTLMEDIDSQGIQSVSYTHLTLPTTHDV